MAGRLRVSYISFFSRTGGQTAKYKATPDLWLLSCFGASAPFRLCTKLYCLDVSGLQQRRGWDSNSGPPDLY